MDFQVFINIAVAVGGALFGWLLNRIFTLIDRLDKDVRAMPINYVTKDDYRADMGEIKTLLRRIDEKLENKADKHGTAS